MAKADKVEKIEKAQLIALTGVWTGKERIEAGKPLPDSLSDEMRQRLIAKGAAKEDKGA
jgi:hypothetical protein